MNDNTFSNISKEECLKVYKDILNNSEELWTSVKTLAKERKYGPAIAISIVSIEELVKAIIISYDSQGFEFRKIKGINALLKNHGMRYVIAYFLFIGGGFISEFNRIINKALEEPEEIMKFLEEGKKDIRKTYKRIKRHFLKIFVQLKIEKTWFSRVDSIRQNGLYSDYDGQFKSPIAITEEEFNVIIEKLELVKIMGKIVIDYVEKGGESLEKFQLECKTKNYYDEIAKLLTIVNKRQKKPFELLEENF